jgi:hypothetical protein
MVTVGVPVEALAWASMVSPTTQLMVSTAWATSV